MQPKIVLVETSHPGNIGAVARAMKTMCLKDLTLVQPKSFPDPVAFARASGAAELLEEAERCDSLAEAIADCQRVVGVTARNRKLSAPVLTPKALMSELLAEYRDTQVVFVFGRERNGLTNEEIDLCHTVCTIPSNEEYGSLNLAAAVQILTYEWHVAQLEQSYPDSNLSTNKSVALAPAAEMEGFYDHLWETLKNIEFLDEDNPVPLIRKIRRLFDRTDLSSAEINILRGILKSINKSIS
ncbi:MAG: RNA methyltransferase [Pseudomonadota bacterium]